MNQARYKIWIDTGGTFTDCIGTNNEGNWERIKVLSDGSLRAKVTKVLNGNSIKIKHHWPIKKNLLSGYNFTLLGDKIFTCKVISFDPQTQTLVLDDGATSIIAEGDNFSITAGEEAPILAARLITQTRLPDKLPKMAMKLGSTKGTNALLERKGAKVAFLVTEGFKDLLVIGTQQRPDLFSLNIKKPSQLYDSVFEIPERIGANGKIIKPLEGKALEKILQRVVESDCESVAVALLNSYRNPIHEKLIAKRLKESGINFISCSNDLAPAIKYLPRANTAVVNAYLNPIIKKYLSGIVDKLSGSQLKVMTSAGGIIDHLFFHPKDSLFSGPAGGVVGAAFTGQNIGENKLIAFDMGGTSTDVSRYDHGFDYQFETKVGAATLLSPTLAIETVAAGGGSVCDYDGFKLIVGPNSAGAYPGPACYGCGGPLTITDVNFLLGRLDESAFSIPLNRDAAKMALEKIKGKVCANNEDGIEEIEILEGFLTIANETMAETVKKISVAKGFDPTAYNLLAFGGAGAQHACEIAALLHMTKVTIPYNAGILSAYGIGNAAIERYAQQDILQPLDEYLDKIPSEVARLKNLVIEKLTKEGISKSNIKVNYIKIFLRIIGQDNSIEIDYLDGVNLNERFHEAYEHLFNHRSSKEEIELASIKCIASSKEFVSIPKNKVELQAKPVPANYISSYSAGNWVEIPVFRWESLPANELIKGTCLVLSQNSTVFVPANWEFKLDDHDNLLLTQRPEFKKKALPFSKNKQALAISLELFTNRFRGLVNEMGALLRRTAFSVNIKERLDFSCALLDQHGELIVNAPHIPVHLGSLGVCVRSVIKTLKLNPGDVIITNHPGYGGSHLPDITLIKALFDENENLIGYVANRAHHAEIGGKRPGSMPPDAVRLTEEGVIIKPTYLVKQGKVKWDDIKSLLTGNLYPSRAVKENIADLQAGIASLNQGEKSLHQLLVQFGEKEIRSAMQMIKNQSYDIIQNALNSYEGTTFKATEQLDDNWEIKVAVSVVNRHAILDFAGTSTRHPKNFNATPAIVNSAILYVFRLMTTENIPLNEGILKAFTIKLPICFLNPLFPENDRECPAVVGGNTETSQRLVDTLIKGFKLAACSQGTMNNLLFGNDDFGYYETIGGGVGAIDGSNGASAIHQHMTNTRITDPEILEFRYPVRLERFAIRKESGGKGKWHGGNGIERALIFLETVDLTVLAQHRLQQPYGMAGGEPGKVGRQYVIRKNGEKITLSGVEAIKMYPMDKIVIKTPGGGGFGKNIS